jgi:hypothetical protein
MARTASGGFVSLMVDVLGDMNRMILSGGTLTTGCNPLNNAAGMCNFSGATFTIRDPITNAIIFTDTGVSGSISKMPTGAVIKGILPKDSELPRGGSVSFVVSFNSTSPFSPTLLNGSGIALVPEPSPLEGLLLGTGLLGLTGIMRRKLKLGTEISVSRY